MQLEVTEFDLFKLHNLNEQRIKLYKKALAVQKLEPSARPEDQQATKDELSWMRTLKRKLETAIDGPEEQE